MPTDESERLEEERRKVAAVASFAVLGRGELPDGRPLMEMAMLEAAGKLWDANKEMIAKTREGPPPDLMVRRFR